MNPSGKHCDMQAILHVANPTVFILGALYVAFALAMVWSQNNSNRYKHQLFAVLAILANGTAVQCPCTKVTEGNVVVKGAET